MAALFNMWTWSTVEFTPDMCTLLSIRARGSPSADWKWLWGRSKLIDGPHLKENLASLLRT